MESLILPSTFSWQDGSRPFERILTIEPCYFGYGTTLGNALRRVLLSSLPGAAATAVRIDGVSHEFSAISGVQEDAVEILLNLKQLRMKVFSEEPVTLVLDVKGKREVTAADIEKNAEVEIVQPDLHLATLTNASAHLRMEITVRRGRGYSPTETRGKEKNPIGTMAIDAVFTPIRNVGFRVENTRVGDITNYDRLILTIETDGSITPEDAVAQAAQLVMDHFTLILQPQAAPAADATEPAASEALTNGDLPPVVEESAEEGNGDAA